MTFVASLYTKLRSMLSPSRKSAAQAWQDANGEAEHAFWLYAAPVNLLLGRDSFFLSDPAPLSITQDESVSLIESLNQHFANDGYHFYLQGGQWFLGLNANPNITTSDVDQVVSKEITAYLPQGEGALAWATLQNEIQMLLFQHPINQARETQGLPAVNSVWCYGLGKAV